MTNPFLFNPFVNGECYRAYKEIAYKDEIVKVKISQLPKERQQWAKMIASIYGPGAIQDPEVFLHKSLLEEKPNV